MRSMSHRERTGRRSTVRFLPCWKPPDTFSAITHELRVSGRVWPVSSALLANPAEKRRALSLDDTAHRRAAGIAGFAGTAVDLGALLVVAGGAVGAEVAQRRAAG